MKILLLTLLISISAFSQKQKFYLLIDDAITIANKNEAVGAYEFRLAVTHHNTKNDIDYYNFIVNIDANKAFENGGVEIPEPKFITSDELKKMYACDIHDLMSQASEVYLVKRKENKKYDAWMAQYFGTVRNLVVTRLRKN